MIWLVIGLVPVVLFLAVVVGLVVTDETWRFALLGTLTVVALVSGIVFAIAYGLYQVTGPHPCDFWTWQDNRCP